jgi:3-deoxy-manno-octulosonate cytidylyltransferase (CMP-KDO synthetase)
VSNDKKILNAVTKYGGKTLRTSKKHLNGTSRCCEAAKLLKSDFFLILQGDEILALPRHIDQLINEALKKPHIKTINLISKLKTPLDLKDENIVKCFLGKDRQVVALFRKSPSVASPKMQMEIVFKVLGMFIFEANTLRNLSKTKTQPLEKLELIEQLRIQEIGIPLNTLQVDRSLESVNTAKDLIKVKKYLGTNQEQKIILSEILKHEK